MRLRDDTVIVTVISLLALLLFILSYMTMKETKACEARGGVYKIFKGGGVCFNPDVLR